MGDKHRDKRSIEEQDSVDATGEKDVDERGTQRVGKWPAADPSAEF